MLQNQRNQIVNNQLTRSLQNINYSQWERKKSLKQPPRLEMSKTSTAMIQNPPMVFKMPLVKDQFGVLIGGQASRSATVSGPAALFTVSRAPHPPKRKESFKTQRQLKEEEEKKALSKLKIRYAREELARLRIREDELHELNESLLDYISRTEKQANLTVDSVLRRFENYQNLKKTVEEKHFEELKEAKRELDELKRQLAGELPKYEKTSNDLEEEVRKAQELSHVLSVYKNQEYPEKLLQINKLRKELGDLNNLHNQEFNNLQEMISHEKDAMKKSRYETTKTIGTNVSKKALQEMHVSLKDMAGFNASLKQQIEFYTTHLENLKIKTSKVDKEVKNLRADSKRSDYRKFVFKEILLKQPKTICTPDMDVNIDYTDE